VKRFDNEMSDMSEFRDLDDSTSKSSESVEIDVFGTLGGCNIENYSRLQLEDEATLKRVGKVFVI